MLSLVPNHPQTPSSANTEPPLVWHEFDFGNLRRLMPEPAVRKVLAVQGIMALPRWEFAQLKGRPEFWYFSVGELSLRPGERHALARSIGGARTRGESLPASLRLDPCGMISAGVGELHHLPRLEDVQAHWLAHALLTRPTAAGLQAALATKQACSLQQLQDQVQAHGLTAVRLRALMPLSLPSGLPEPHARRCRL